MKPSYVEPDGYFTKSMRDILNGKKSSTTKKTTIKKTDKKTSTKKK